MLWATIGALIAAAVTGVAVFVFVLRAEPVPVAVPDGGVRTAVVSARTPATAAQACTTLAAALPDTLAGLSRRLTTPASPRTAAWGNPAVVMRCGVAAPPASADLPVQVGPVAWRGERLDSGAAVAISADRVVAVEVSVPPEVPADRVLTELGPALATLPAAVTAP